MITRLCFTSIGQQNDSILTPFNSFLTIFEDLIMDVKNLYFLPAVPTNEFNGKRSVTSQITQVLFSVECQLTL